MVVLLLLLTGGGVADARPSTSQRIFVVGRVEDPTATITASGMITGTGTLTAESVDFDQATDSYVETDLAAVGGGTLTVLVHGAFDTWPFTLDPRTCTRSGRITGTWTVTGTGGDLAGVAGGGTLAGHFLTYAAHGHGGCDVNDIKGFVAGPMTGDLHRITLS
ncbi:MAG TPA: hypothetical protein VH333_01710 [Pseudonocardiaceae bacterium]|nr:hypothetical protein [Pseudonocardiaceae bacterium]